MPRRLGISQHEIWACKTRLKRGVLFPVLILIPGSHYEASIQVCRADVQDAEPFWTRRAYLPCLWENVEDWIDAHPEFSFEEEATVHPVVAEGVDWALREKRLLQAIRDVLEAHSRELAPLERLAYSASQLAQALGLSDQQIYNHVNRGDLTPKYSGTKMIIPVDEARRFVERLPDENRGPL